MNKDSLKLMHTLDSSLFGYEDLVVFLSFFIWKFIGLAGYSADLLASKSYVDAKNAHFAIMYSLNSLIKFE